MISSQDTRPAAFAVLQAWAPSVVWSAPTAGTNQDAVPIDDERRIEAGMIQTQQVTATVTPAQYAQHFIDQRGSLDAALTKAGWSRHTILDADGAMGTQWGYARTTGEGMSFLVVTATAQDCAPATDGPDTCKSYRATVEQTSPLAAGDDL